MPCALSPGIGGRTRMRRFSWYLTTLSLPVEVVNVNIMCLIKYFSSSPWRTSMDKNPISMGLILQNCMPIITKPSCTWKPGDSTSNYFTSAGHYFPTLFDFINFYSVSPTIQRTSFISPITLFYLLS